MNIEQNMEMANEIADLIIDKSFWGNEWFVFFCLLLVGLLSALCAWGGSYLSTRSQNAAIRADFDKALENLEKQTEAVKGIEEQISHAYLEEREISRIKRDKIEQIYECVSEEISVLSQNHSTALACMSKGQVYPSNKTEMLISLYFKNEMQKELDFYLEHRKPVLTLIRELEQANYERNDQQLSMAENMKHFEHGAQLFRNLNQARINIEIALEEQMKNLTRR